MPFQVGQVVEVASLTGAITRAIKAGLAEVIRETEPERAVAMAPRSRRQREKA